MSNPVDEYVDSLKDKKYSVWENVWAIVKTLYFLSPAGYYLHPEKHELYSLSYKYIENRKLVNS